MTKILKRCVKSIKRVARNTLDFVLPRQCIVCGRTNAAGEYDYVCPDCVDKLHIINGAVCLRCGEVVGLADMPDVRQCFNCAARPPEFSESLVCCAFNDAARNLVRKLKYAHATYLLRDMGRIIRSNRRAEKFVDNSILIPVPLHPSRYSKRGYNQAELIAKQIVKEFPKANAQVRDILIRRHQTPTQTALDRDSRKRNMLNAFTVRHAKATLIDKHAPIILVDDVMTTGATLSECARTLKKFGFENVRAFAFARRM